jgi:uncharacterized membrane protein YczE
MTLIMTHFVGMFLDVLLKLMNPPDTITSNVICLSINNVEYASEFRLNLVIRQSLEVWP